MWQCRRCDSEVDEAVPGCARCPFPFDIAALERAATGDVMAHARNAQEAAGASEIVPASVIGIRYSDVQSSKRTSYWYRVDLAFANRPARSYELKPRFFSANDPSPDRELLGQIMIVFIDGDTVYAWWPLVPRLPPPPEAPVHPDFPRASVVAPTAAGIPDEPFPPSTIAGIPRGARPLLTPAGALVGLPIDTLRPRVTAAHQNPAKERAMTAELPRTLDVHFGDLLFLLLGLGLTFGFWGYGAYLDSKGEKSWAEIPTTAMWVGGVMSVVGVLFLVIFVRAIVQQLRAPVTRTIVAVVDARTTEHGDTRVGLATLLFEDGAVREYKVLRPGRAAATAGAVGVACFREDYVMAFLPL